MKSFTYAIVSLGILAAPLMAGSTMAQDAAACRFEKPELICAKSVRDGEAVLNAMANPVTMALLKNALVDGEARKLAYGDGYEREDYRKSLEANRKSATRYARRAFRRYKRRRLSADAYEAIRVKYKAAVEAYSIGMDVYRAGTWHSKTPRK